MRKCDEAVSEEVQTDIGKRFFTETVVNQWVPRDLVMASSPSEFKECLDNIFSHMVLVLVAL